MLNTQTQRRVERTNVKGYAMTTQGYPNSHIDFIDGAWWFWNEPLTEKYGPYATRTKALIALYAYAKTLE